MEKRQFHTPGGIEFREPTPEEIENLRTISDRAVLRDDFKKAVTLEEKVNIIAKALDLVR